MYFIIITAAFFLCSYHDADDEPSCRSFTFDLENISMEKETIKKAIVKEISDYHSKYLRPKLTPLATKFFPKPIQLKDDEMSPEVASKIFLF